MPSAQIEANPVRAKLVRRTGDYPWSRFGAHGKGCGDALLDPVPGYEGLAAYPAVRRRRWSGYVHQAADEAELAGIRRSSATGLPDGATRWVAGV